MEAKKKIIEYIQQFPEFYQKQVKVIDEGSMTPIVCACRSGSLDCVKQILKKSKINLSMKGRKKNPLIEAAEYGHYEIVKFLIMQGADIQQLNSRNCSALKKAVLNDHFDIVKYLIENGAAKNLDKISITFMMDAVLQSADYDMIIYFDNHFNIPYDLITGFGRTNGERYMDIACSNQDEKTIDFLLNKNVGLSKIDIPKLINSKKIFANLMYFFYRFTNNFTENLMSVFNYYKTITSCHILGEKFMLKGKKKVTFYIKTIICYILNIFFLMFTTRIVFPDKNPKTYSEYLMKISKGDRPVKPEYIYQIITGN